MRNWQEIIDRLLEITEKYEEVMTNEDLEKLSELHNEYFIQFYDGGSTSVSLDYNSLKK